jgi:hypothetical protein
MNFRRATLDDWKLLAELNHQLIRDEGHRSHNTTAIAFWRSVGFRDYCLTLEILPPVAEQ